MCFNPVVLACFRLKVKRTPDPTIFLMRSWGKTVYIDEISIFRRRYHTWCISVRISVVIGVVVEDDVPRHIARVGC